MGTGILRLRTWYLSLHRDLATIINRATYGTGPVSRTMNIVATVSCP